MEITIFAPDLILSFFSVSTVYLLFQIVQARSFSSSFYFNFSNKQISLVQISVVINNILNNNNKYNSSLRKFLTQW